MSYLRIFDQNAQTLSRHSSREEIGQTLAGHGIQIEHWTADQGLSDASTQAEILNAYNASVNRIMREGSFQKADVVSVNSHTPNHQTLRQKFLAEHTHTDDEVRFFVDGSGLFYVNAGEKIIGILCERGDLLRVPAGTKHWFDMGSAPHFKCIRIFTDEAGWVGHFTESALEKRFPDFDRFRKD